MYFSFFIFIVVYMYNFIFIVVYMYNKSQSETSNEPKFSVECGIVNICKPIQRCLNIN